MCTDVQKNAPKVVTSIDSRKNGQNPNPDIPLITQTPTPLKVSCLGITSDHTSKKCHEFSMLKTHS